MMDSKQVETKGENVEVILLLEYTDMYIWICSNPVSISNGQKDFNYVNFLGSQKRSNNWYYNIWLQGERNYLRIRDARTMGTDPALGLAAKESDQQAKSSYSRE